MTALWTYVIKVDDGKAPHFGPPCVTLAICKPDIRRNAQPGDIVLAYTGRHLSGHPHSVYWAGIVSEAMTLSNYWLAPRFQRKKECRRLPPDNIYRPTPSGLVQIPNLSHDRFQTNRDLGGKNVLVFEKSWLALNRKMPAPFSQYHMPLHARRKHKRFELTGMQAQRLVSWLSLKFVHGSLGAWQRNVGARSIQSTLLNQRPCASGCEPQSRCSGSCSNPIVDED